MATPWVLMAPCHEAKASSVFVQGVILDKINHTLSTYSPLVIDDGTTPAAAPIVPMLPVSYDAAFFIGGNNDATTLVGVSSQCVNGEDGQVFGQVAFCGTDKFWSDIRVSGIVPPPLGIGKDGLICPTTRDFRIVDQDQSDNVQTTYLFTADGRTAQNTEVNRALLVGAGIQKNASDNRLLTNFIDPALGCHPWMIPDIADGGNLIASQATDEIQAAWYQSPPMALVPAGDPMVGPNLLNMVNAYRAGVNQPQIGALSMASTQAYCNNLKAIQPQWLAAHKQLFLKAPSPVPAAGATLYDFLTGRLAATYMILGCAL
jgi:hypothetical protein